MIEALGPAEEGIGHILCPHLRREIEEGTDLAARFMAACGQLKSASVKQRASALRIGLEQGPA